MTRKIYKGLSEAERTLIKTQAWEEAGGGRSLKKVRKTKRKAESKAILQQYEAAKQRLAAAKRAEQEANKIAVAEQAQKDQLQDGPVDGVLPCEQNEPTDPCYLDKLIVKVIRPQNSSPPPAAATEDPAALDQEALQLQQDIDANQEDLDRALGSGTSTLNEGRLAELKVRREELEDQLIDLTRRRAEAGTPPAAVWAPPVNPREFTIVPDAVAPDVPALTAPLQQPRTELSELTANWRQVHDRHEKAKKELQSYAKKKEKLAKAKDTARLQLEQAKRALREKEQALRSQLEDNLNAARNRDEIDEARRKLQKFANRNTERLQKTDKAHRRAEKKFNTAKDKYQGYATGAEYTETKQREESLRARLRTLTTQINAKVDELSALEQSILVERNTLASGTPIDVTGGSEKRYIAWLSDDDGSLVDETPEIEIELDGGVACADDPPKSYRLRSGVHRHIVCTEKSGEKPVLSTDSATTLPKFKVHQVRQWDDKLGQTRIPGVRQLQQAAQFFRTIAAIFGRAPRLREYAVQAGACGIDDEGQPGATDTLKTTINVYPADKFAITITTPAAFGQSYERELTVAKADAPVAETGQLQYESSGSEVEVSDKETTSTSRFGITQSSSSTEHVTGYSVSEGRKDKDVVITTDAQREGGLLGTMNTTTQADGSHHGESYTGTLVTSNSYNWGGFGSTRVEALTETGSVADRHDPVSGQLMSAELHRGEDEKSGNTSTMNPGDQLKRVPAVPGSFFPQIPVDISFTRNDREDEFTQNIKSAVGTTIWLTRQLGVFIGRVGNVVPSMGYKFGYSVNFLNGKFLYQRQWREHIDRNVWEHKKCELDITIVTARVFVFAGISVSIVILEFELGIEVHIKGSIGVKASIENRHPDMNHGADVGVGPTGSIGCGAEVRLVIGQADWCKASGDISTSVGVEAVWWIAHGEGPYADMKIGFEGVKAKLVFHLVLVGHWEKGHTICKERELWSGRYPKAFDEQRLNEQSEAMEAERATASKEALKLEEKIRKRRATEA